MNIVNWHIVIYLICYNPLPSIEVPVTLVFSLSFERHTIALPKCCNVVCIASFGCVFLMNKPLHTNTILDFVVLFFLSGVGLVRSIGVVSDLLECAATFVFLFSIVVGFFLLMEVVLSWCLVGSSITPSKFVIRKTIYFCGNGHNILPKIWSRWNNLWPFSTVVEFFLQMEVVLS